MWLYTSAKRHHFWPMKHKVKYSLKSVLEFVISGFIYVEALLWKKVMVLVHIYWSEKKTFSYWIQKKNKMAALDRFS